MHCTGAAMHDLWYAVSWNQTSTRGASDLRGHPKIAYRSRSLDDLSFRTKDPAFLEPVKKIKKSPNILHTLFRRRRSSRHSVFGLPLAKVCDENLDPPESIIRLMVLVYQQGPQTPGILRRGNKASLSKEIRDKIDSGESFPLDEHMAPTAASVFKEFLRSIPEGLLVNDLYEHWTTLKRDIPRAERITKIKIILAKLPPAHYRMVKFTICLLQHLAKYSSQNYMGPSNLAMCIAPSFYAYEAPLSPQSRMRRESLKQMQMQNSFDDIQNVFVPLISFMIVNHVELFGEDILTMFTKYGCQASPPMNLMIQEDYLHSDHIYETNKCLQPAVSSPNILQQSVDSSCRSSQKFTSPQETNAPREKAVSSPNLPQQPVDSACISSQKSTSPQETNALREKAVWSSNLPQQSVDSACRSSQKSTNAPSEKAVSSPNLPQQSVDSARRSSQKSASPQETNALREKAVWSSNLPQQSVDSACRSSQKSTSPQETNAPREIAVWSSNLPQQSVDSACRSSQKSTNAPSKKAVSSPNVPQQSVDSARRSSQKSASPQETNALREKAVWSSNLPQQSVDSACRSSQKSTNAPSEKAVSSPNLPQQSVDSACRSSQKSTPPQETNAPRQKAVWSSNLPQQSVDSAHRSSQKSTSPQEMNAPREKAVSSMKLRLDVLYCF